MITILRSEEPAKLRSSKAKDAWQSVPDVRKTLREMQDGKCCYCEEKVPIGRQEIEHFWPRSGYCGKRNSWTNLLIACDLCNRKKGDLFPLDSLEQPLLIDPTAADINPEKEIAFITQVSDDVEYLLIGEAVPISGSVRGEETITVVGLSRHDYRRKRRHYYEQILHPWLVRYAEAHDDGNEVELEVLRGEIERLMRDRAQYAGFVRAFARQHSLPVTVPDPGTV